MLKRLLVGVAGSEVAPAKIAYAIDLARRFQANITGLAIVDTPRLAHLGPVPLGGSAAAQALSESRRQRSTEASAGALQMLVDRCRSAAVPCAVQQVEGDAIEALAAAWRSHDLTLLALEGWFDHDVMAEPERAIDRVLAAGLNPLVAAPYGERPIRRAGALYDGTRDAAEALKRFIQLALWPAASIDLICTGHEAARSQDLLREATAYCTAHGFVCRGHAVSTSRPEEIGRLAADLDVDLIVLPGTLRRGLLDRLFGNGIAELVRGNERAVFFAD